MNGRDERLRELLRDADPARQAPEVGAAEVARMRRTVLSAVHREERPWSARPSFALACAAAMAAVVLGLALWRFGLTWKPTADEHRAARPSTTPGASPTTSARSATVSAAKPRSPSVAATSAAAAHAELASAGRSTATAAARARRRSSGRAIDSAPARPSIDTAPAETMAAAQPASEPQPPYQLQLTAPGGTRIVWLLGSSSGR